MQKKMKDFKKENAGRSMTEMLGVLAIIGVLSLGGIIGYKLAMNRYAANQIAYEINMMKTDAKVKIMQGNDALTLGQPYDGGTIRFGDYGTTFGCSFIKDADDESVVEEAATCQVANAYYIELQNIPEGICKPLANLINNMNDLIAFDINLTESEEGRVGDDCEEGENVLNAVFSAEPGDLDVLKCDSEKDCLGGLHCHNHLCVECIDAGDCEQGNAGICTENNTCDYCNKGEVRDENDNCVECMEDKDCRDKENAPHCDSETHTCGNCPIGTPYWSDTLSKCVECTSSDFCVNPEPYCNPNTGECTQCTEDAQCDASQNEHCKVETGECITCEENEIWSDEFKECIIASCRTNKECNVNNKSGYYCYMRLGYSCTSEFSSTDPDYISGQCRRVKTDLANEVPVVMDGKRFYGSKKEYMTWWSACRFCAAQTGGNEDLCNSEPGPSFMVDYSMFKCEPEIDIANNKSGYCYAGSADKGVSESIKIFRTVGGCDKEDDSCWYHFWLRNKHTDLCHAYNVDSDTSHINASSTLNNVYRSSVGRDGALCQQE